MSSLPALLRVIGQEAFMNVNVLSRCRMGVLLLAAMVGSAAAARADDGHFGHPHFTARDINRSYGYSCSGTIVAPAPSAFLGPFAQIGQVSCDGRDTCSGPFTVNFNGNIFSGTASGPYTVKGNGEGDVKYTVKVPGFADSLLPIHFVIVDDGRGIRGLPTTAGYIVTCDLKEQ
jgi:hypothetical protein